MIENVQRRLTKHLPDLFNYFYIARFKHLKLNSLEEKRMANNRIFLFKVIHMQVDVDVKFDKYFSFNNNNFNTQGHSMKLNVNHSRFDRGKLLFCIRGIKV